MSRRNGRAGKQHWPDLRNESSDLNLNAVALGLGLENIEYEPEQFPGLVYRIKQPKVVVLIFSSGKLVITGGKSPEDCVEGARIVRMQLENMGLL